jgi:hypothetical protein
MSASEEIGEPGSGRWNIRWLPACCLFAICALYAIQLWTPLRLTGDSIELLSVASSASEGHGFLNHGEKTHYFPGYPLMVVGLERAGAAHSWGFVGLNALFMILAFANSYYIAREYFQLSNSWAVCALLFTSSSFVLIKHFALPLTDIPFFGLSITSVALSVRAEKSAGTKFCIYWAASLITSFLAISVRPIGIALLPCLALLVITRLGVGRVLRSRSGLLIAASSAALLSCATAIALIHTKYVHEALARVTHQGVAHSVSSIFLFRAREFGEIFLNAPASKLGPLANIVGLCGTAAAVFLLTCFRSHPPKIGALEVYLLVYACITLVWPYEDTRFWIPVLPLIYAELLSAIRHADFSIWQRTALVTYSAAYVIMGVLAIAYSTRITFSGADFPNQYGDYHLRSTYQLFYSDRSTDMSNINANALEILKRYSRR